MEKLASFLRLMAIVIPAVLELVRSIEAALPVGGKGAEKLGLFRELIAASYEAAGDGSVSLDDVMRLAERAAGVAVKFFNRTGAFQTTNSPQ